MKEKGKLLGPLTDKGIVLPVPFWLELLLSIILCYYSYELLGIVGFLLACMLLVFLFVLFSCEERERERD